MGENFSISLYLPLYPQLSPNTLPLSPFLPLFLRQQHHLHHFHLDSSHSLAAPEPHSTGGSWLSGCPAVVVVVSVVVVVAVDGCL